VGGVKFKKGIGLFVVMGKLFFERLQKEKKTLFFFQLTLSKIPPPPPPPQTHNAIWSKRYLSALSRLRSKVISD